MTDSAKQFWNTTYKDRAMVAAVDFAQTAFGYLKDKPGCSILDVGCGDGRDSLFLAREGFQVTAIDFSEKAIDRLHSVDATIDARVMDIQDLRFPDESFDAVYAHLSLHYFDDAGTDNVFASIHRILKPGGFLFVKCKSTKDPLYGKGTRIGEDMFVLKHERHFFSPEYLRAKLGKFTVISIDETASAYDGKESAFVEGVARK